MRKKGRISPKKEFYGVNATPRDLSEVDILEKKKNFGDKNGNSYLADSCPSSEPLLSEELIRNNKLFILKLLG